MDDYHNLCHSIWDCKYHVVFNPKCRKKALHGEIRRRMGEVFRALARQKESQLLEGHLMSDHVHMLISIPPKYSVAQVIGYIKGKGTIHIARTFFDHKRNSVGQHVWGSRLLHVDRRSRRSSHPRVHPQTGGGGSTAGAVAPAIARHL